MTKWIWSKFWKFQFERINTVYLGRMHSCQDKWVKYKFVTCYNYCRAWHNVIVICYPSCKWTLNIYIRQLWFPMYWYGSHKSTATKSNTSLLQWSDHNLSDNSIWAMFLANFLILFLARSIEHKLLFRNRLDVPASKCHWVVWSSKSHESHFDHTQ